MQLRPVFFLLGILLSILAVVMCVPAALDAHAGRSGWRAFLGAAGFTLFFGAAMATAARGGEISLSLRQGFLVTTLAWVFVTAFASIPFMFSEYELSLADAFFEAMSGITTTGATVILGLDAAPPGLLLWRALLQWLGGIGIIVMAIAILPALRVGGMELFRMESSEKGEKVLPRLAGIAIAIAVIYAAFTVLWAGAYGIAGMGALDAVAHAMTTIATGGFSTRDASFAHFASPAADWTAVAGMLVGSLPFVLYLRALRGDPAALARDGQVHAFFAVVAALVAATWAGLWLENRYDAADALRHAAFNVISVITGTGYASADFSQWGNYAQPIFLFSMFIGGCAGSTTCGIKIFRFQVLAAATRAQVHHMLQPHGVFVPYYQHRPIPREVIVSVLSFFFLFGATFALVAIALGLIGLDFLTAVSSAATAISNVGPGLGPVVGPAGTFQPLPDAAKWLLSFAMLLGRLELFPIVVLLSRSFWRD
jgi:trk system potassium uptake protein TrkH